MGLFGGDSVSTSTQQTQNITDERVYADYSNQGGSKSENIIDVKDASNINLNMLDGGAVNASYDFSKTLVDEMTKMNRETVDYMTQAQLAGYNVARDVVSTATEAQRTESENVWINVIKWGSLAGIIMVIAWSVSRKRG